jgi:glutamine synthetase
VIHDAFHKDGTPFEIAPRNVLKRVVQLYTDKGLRPVVAPEMEFYLVKPNLDPDYPLEPPVGRSGRPERARQAYSISAVNEFEELFDDVYRFSEEQGLEIDTLAHEDGTAQMEINLQHGDAVDLADQVFLFKRTIREAALRHKMYATFMAKPIATEPGSAMHIHHSVIELKTGRNLFSDASGELARAFLSYIAGMQTYLPRVMCMLAPYVNSYRRIIPHTSAPINVRWGYDNRTVGLRVPLSDPQNRRVENRIPSSDANPYLAIAASLACGYLGLVKQLEPEPPSDALSRDPSFALPRSILDAVRLLETTPELVEIFGETFVRTYRGIKETEYETFMGVISPWEREYLLLSV